MSTAHKSRQRHSFRRAEAIYERLARDNPTVTRVRLGWAQLLIGGERSFFGDLNEQLKYRKLSVQLLRELVASDPGVPPVVAGLGLGLTFYGFVLWEAGQRSEGMHLLRESVELFETRDFSEFSYGDATGAFARLISARNLAIALALSGQAAEGLGVVGRSLAVGERVIARQNSRSVRESSPESRPAFLSRVWRREAGRSRRLSRTGRRHPGADGSPAPPRPGSWASFTRCGISKADLPHRAGTPSPPAAPSTLTRPSPWYVRPPTAVMLT